MKVIPLDIPEVLLIEPTFFGDSRGWFLETWQISRYAEAGIPEIFVQDNVSSSSRGVLRGLHFQNPHGQGKLVQVLEGVVYDVAVDIRVGSPMFGKYVGETLTAEKHNQLYIPPGFAHGFCVLSERAVFSYKCTDFYMKDCEGGILWNDPEIAIPWPVENPELSDKDRSSLPLSQMPKENLPGYEGGR